MRRYIIIFFFLLVSTGLARPPTPLQNCTDSPVSRIVWFTQTYPYEVTNSEVLHSMLNLTATSVHWDSQSGANIPNTERGGWVLIIEKDGDARAVEIHRGNDRVYLFVFGTMQWFGADYNPKPQPHITCGIWHITTNQYYELVELARQYKYKDK